MVTVLHQSDPYREGFEAFKQQVYVGDNPYSKKTAKDSYESWECGWYDAQFDELGFYDKIQ